MGKTSVLLVLLVLTVFCLWKQTEAKPYLRLSRAFNRGLMMGAMTGGLGGNGGGRRRRTYVMPMGKGGYSGKGGYGGHMTMMQPMHSMYG